MAVNVGDAEEAHDLICGARSTATAQRIASI